MSFRHRVTALLGVAGLGLSLVPAVVSPVYAAAGSRAPGTSTVTLLTGDVVTLASADGRAVAVRPGHGRRGMRFAIERTGAGLFVIPADALARVRSGVLDRRLFDVAGLARAGLDDRGGDSLPVIVQYAGSSARAQATASLAKAGARMNRELPAVRGAAMSARKDRTGRLWTALRGDGVGRIWLDGVRQVSLDRSVPQIGAPQAWGAGLTGRGVTVAVLDTGVDTGHPDLAGKVTASVTFTDGPATDDVGHGTHVASIIAGSGVASGGRLKGVAPDANLVSGKVCDARGCPDSAILAGMHWAAVDQRADVVNLSLGGPDGPGVDPLEEAIGTLSAQYGTLFVVAAGNEGRAATIESPGSADAALTVGAVDRSDTLAGFSAQGPRIGDDAVKPDITAPGVGIVAARAAGTGMDTPVDDSHTAASGTSMATPHVAGAAALVAQQHPDWTGDRVKATLVAAAASDGVLSAYHQGAGRVDVARAVAQTVSTTPASVSFGRQAWPQTGSAVARTVTYRNTGTTGVTLTLAITATGPGGGSAPAGMFAVSPRTLTVPAGGTADVTLTADAAVSAPAGAYSGLLTATADGIRAVAPLGLTKEEESYDLTLSFLDHTGVATQAAFATLTGLDREVWSWPAVAPDGTAVVRLPKGRYTLGAYIDSDAGTALLGQPVVDLTKNLAITLDARTARPVTLTIPEPSARLGFVDVGFTYYPTYLTYGLGVLLWGDDLGRVSLGQVGTATSELVVGGVAAQWARADGTGEFTDSPYLYAVARSFPGRIPTGYARTYRAKDFAALRQTFVNSTPGQAAERTLFPAFTPRMDTSALVVPTTLPGARTEYVSTENVRWTGELTVGVRDDGGWLVPHGRLRQQATAYQAGEQYRDEWNAGPFGPAFGQAGPAPWQWASRTGDRIDVELPLYADRAGHPSLLVATDTARTALYRDGELVGENEWSGGGSFTVPPQPGEYRLEVADTRSTSDLTTRLSAVWTFRSGHLDGAAGPVQLPLASVRFAPALDAARAGCALDLPVTVEAHVPTQVAALTVEVSFDDGATWAAAPLRTARSGWIASVRHPAAARYVSLRASAVDTAGNTVTQTLIHAYRLL
ncbi:MAG: S8 family serine peptidase [Hamadaea sp.]|nr:S8 family serine peptidase [Hamadaea sp.]